MKGIVSVSEHKTVEEDASYFQSYAHYGIHYEMLSDKVSYNVLFIRKGWK